jgi:phage-related protein
MKRRNSLGHYCLILLAISAVLVAAPVKTQSQNTQPQNTRSQNAATPDRDDATRRQLASFDHFLDSHPEVAEQLRKDPSLVNDKEFVEKHPQLQQYLADHPEVRGELSQNPNAIMHQEERFDRRGDQNVTRTELAKMDRFMDSHPEIAEQLRKDPSLVDNKEFVKSHPALQQFLADHGDVRAEYKENPNAFMHQEERFDRREDGYGRVNRDVTGKELGSFNEFMESHGSIASELSKTPALANNQEYLENHPALQDYLKAHPEVHEELSENPQSFLESAQQFNGHSTKKVASDSKLK